MLSVGEEGICWTGENMGDVAQFISKTGTFFEFDGSNFIIPRMGGNITVKKGDWVVRGTDGVYRVLESVDVFAIEPEVKKKKYTKRGKK